MGRIAGISETPYRGIVKALKAITTTLNLIHYDLQNIKNANNLQTQYLEVIGRKINKKGFKRYFGKRK